MADENKTAYASREWHTGDVITADALNKIENEMEYVSAEVTNAVTGTINDQKLNDTIARKLDSIVKYFPEEPTEENLENVRMYVQPAEDNGEITVPTIDDYQTFKTNFVQPYTNKAYAVGDYVEYGDVIYKVISAITKNGNLTDDEAWTALTAQTPSPVREIDVMKEVNNLINVYTSDSQLTQEQNKIWIKQQGESVEVPSYEEFTTLSNSVVDLKSAIGSKADSDLSNVADNAISPSLINGVLSYSRLTEFDDYTVANNNRIYAGTNRFADTTETGISNTGIVDLSALSGIDTINIKFSTTQLYQVFVIQKSNDSVAGYYLNNLPSSFATNKGNYYEINLAYLRSVNTVKFAVNFDTGTEEVITYTETVSQEAKSLEWLRLSANNGHVPIIVDANGNGDYTTIQAAVDAASDYDEILVMPGTYEEAVTVSNKYIYIRGLDANTTKLVNHSGAYATCPLQMCTGVLENMTVYHQKTGEVSVSRYGFAIHLDQVWGTRMQLRNFTIRNCIVISDFATTIGCGVVDGCRVIIDGCKIIHTGVLNDRQAAFQVHGDSANDGSAFFVIRNSILDVPTTSTANAILFTNGGSNTGTTFDLLSLNNVITKMYNNVGDLLTINPLSYGNNISALNLASEY